MSPSGKRSLLAFVRKFLSASEIRRVACLEFAEFLAAHNSETTQDGILVDISSTIDYQLPRARR